MAITISSLPAEILAAISSSLTSNLSQVCIIFVTNQILRFNMTAIEKIRQYIDKLEKGQTFSAKNLYHLASTDNVRQALGRLTQSGEITRVSRGVFIKPEHVKNIGEVLPSVHELTAMLAESAGEHISIHGAEAARQLQLTTQVPMRPVYYTTGHSRKLKFGSHTIELRHMSPKKLQASKSITGKVIAALSYLGQESVTLDTIQTLQNKLSKEEFSKVTQELVHMPGWMANLFYQHQSRAENPL